MPNIENTKEFIKIVYQIEDVPEVAIENIYKALNELTSREERMIRLKFGLDDGIKRTYNAIGNEFGITGSRIQQIILKGIKKLRHPKRRDIVFDVIPKELNGKYYNGTQLKDVGLSIRTYNCLSRAGINTTTDLCNCSFNDLIHIKNLGRKSYKEILEFMKNHTEVFKEKE